MRIEVGDERIGAAAATKMCRSIVVKGMEAILTECVLGAMKYGAAERVFSSLTESFPGIDWNKLASYMVSRVVVHGERRAREMEEVAETLRSIGIDPIMAEATARRMDSSASNGLKSKFGPTGPATYEEFAQELIKTRRRYWFGAQPHHANRFKRDTSGESGSPLPGFRHPSGRNRRDLRTRRDQARSQHAGDGTEWRRLARPRVEVRD